MLNTPAEHFQPGTHVICSHRMPSTLQPWLHEVYVGIVQEQTEDNRAYNRIVRDMYSMESEKVRVLYPFGLVDESVGYLTPITPEEAKLSYREKIKRFMGPVSLAYYDQARCQLRLPEEERI